MNIANKLLLIIIIVTLYGCGEPTIDTTTDETMATSIEAVKQALPLDKQKEFEEAILLLSMSEIDFTALLTQGSEAGENLEKKVRAKLNGKTGQQVIDEALKIKQEKLEKEKEEALLRIKELEELKLATEQAKLELNKFKIVNSRFYKQKQDFIGDQPIIELKVKNGTEHSISRAYFIGTLKSADREVPWLKEAFNYKISGGLKPGEETTWSLSPNMFSKWGSVKAPKDASFVVEVNQLDGPDEKTLFTTNNFTDKEEKELQDLKNKYN